MKRIFLCGALLILVLDFTSNICLAQSNDRNFILTRTAILDTSYVEQIEYFDGLGRSMQTVYKKQNPDFRDMVTLYTYDHQGRIGDEWLQGIADTNGAFITPSLVMNNTKDLYKDPMAFTKKIYEASTNNRITEQYGPGKDYFFGNKIVKYDYLLNTATGELSCSFYKILLKKSSISPFGKSGNYASGSLSVVKTTDEDGRVMFEFKDQRDHTVLLRHKISETEYNDTYFIYDPIGNLCIVLPPLASGELNTNSVWNATTPVVSDYAYLYSYDSYNRCVRKKRPGTDWICYKYDKAGNCIFTQDGELRKKGSWYFSIPDALGREVITGTCKNTDIDPYVDKIVNASFSLTKGDKITGYYINNLSLVSPKYMSITYYDFHHFLSLHYLSSYKNILDYVSEKGFENREERIVDTTDIACKGLITGKRIFLLGDATGEIISSTFYNFKNLPIQERSINSQTKGYDKYYRNYTFTGKIKSSLHKHFNGISSEFSEIYSYTYDHAERLIKIQHKLGDKSPVLLVDNEYDHIGRLKANKRNGEPNLKTEYTYNVRSWTKSIESPLFKQTLYYNDKRINGSNTPSYSGNITAMDWKIYGDSKDRGYDFTYDKLSRLTNADYIESNIHNNKFDTSYSYDKHGNMLTLTRNGNLGTSTYGMIDNLNLTYRGNQLIKVEDSATNPSLSMSMDFKNGAHEDIEYKYDENGNLVKDLNKGITEIQYNLLNLPMKIIFNYVGNPVNEYIYSADGSKLRVTHKSASGAEKRTDYLGNMIYENGILKCILVDGGYIDMISNKYYFYLQDHLGNNRIVADANGHIVQTNHYYPFGMIYAESIGNEKQPYKYNGKELDIGQGLNWYDYEARQFDVTVPRFMTIDPMAEKFYNWSPYVYCYNNPLKFIDPTGMVGGDFLDKKGKLIGRDGINDNKLYVVRNESLSKSEIKNTKKFIKKNSGRKEAFTKDSKAYTNSIEIEGSEKARQDMVTEVSKDNGKGGTKDANNREYGGSVENGVVITATFGEIANPKTDKTASISLSGGKSTFHSHPSGTVVDRPALESFGTTITHSFIQTPSSQDISNAGSHTHYVFGRSENKVYIYNSNGTQASILMNRFVTPKR